MLLDVADTKIVAATSAVLTFTGRDSDGEPSDPGTVTVGVTNSAGTVVVAAGTATVVDGHSRTVTLTASQTALVDRLTAVWTSDGVAVGTTVHDVVGGVLISSTDFQQREPTQTGVELSSFLRARREVDDLFRRVCHRSFVPAFQVETVDGQERWYGHRGGDVVLRYPHLRSVRFANVINADGTRTAVSDVDLVEPNVSGVAVLRGSACWPSGDLEIGYEHGYDRPPDDVRGAAARLIRDVLGSGTSAVPSRATIYTDAQGATTQLATPGLGPFITGIPEVDEVLRAHRWMMPSVA